MKRFLRKLTAVSLCMMMAVALLAPMSVSAAPAGEVHAVWISFMDMQTMLMGKNQAQFDANFTAACDKVLANAEIKTMIQAFGCGFSEGTDKLVEE